MTRNLTHVDRALCSIHNVNPAKCFWSHQPKQVEVEHGERVMIVLPCSHLADRPTMDHSIVTCDGCGKVWRIRRDASKTAWDAYEVSV